jgi:hypothetical protein
MRTRSDGRTYGHTGEQPDELPGGASADDHRAMQCSAAPDRSERGAERTDTRSSRVDASGSSGEREREEGRREEEETRDDEQRR